MPVHHPPGWRPRQPIPPLADRGPFVRGGPLVRPPLPTLQQLAEHTDLEVTTDDAPAAFGLRTAVIVLVFCTATMVLAAALGGPYVYAGVPALLGWIEATRELVDRARA